MRRGAASRTAMWVSVLRGVADLERGALVRDEHARSLLPWRYRVLVEAGHALPRTTRAVLSAAAVVTGGRSRHFALRTRAIDDVVEREVGLGCRQLVLLGAGLDARAYRMASLSECTVFEVDHPDTQAWKRPRTLRLPRRARDVRFVAVDLARDTLDAPLRAAGHDVNARSVFAWEGVVMYLDREQVRAALRALSALMSPGSVLVATYHGRAETVVSLAVAALVAVAGEPRRSMMDAAAMRALLVEAGFAVESDEGDREWSARYLGHGEGASLERLVVARRT